MNSDGSGEATVLPTTADLFKSPNAWTREGLVFDDIGEETGRDLWLVPTTGEGRATPLIQSRFTEYRAQVSPDGRWIAYLSNEAGAEDVYVQSFPVPGHRTRVSSAGATRMWWMPAGNELCYLWPTSREVMIVHLTQRGTALDVGEPRRMFQASAGIVGEDLAHDGQRFLVSYSNTGAQKKALRVVLNWTELLRR